MPYANPEDQRECKRRSYARDPEKFKTKTKAWRARNPSYKPPRRTRSEVYRFRNKRGLSAEVAKALLGRKPLGCAFCGAVGDLHLDHDVPKSRGGGNDLGNLQWLCPPCNTGKGALTTEEFFAHIQKILARRG